MPRTDTHLDGMLRHLGAACWVAFAVYGAVGHGIRDRAVAVTGFLIIGVIWVCMGVRRTVRDARSQSGDQQ